MTAGRSPLTQDEARRAADAITLWRRDPDQAVACPRCGLEGLGVIDRSVRPYAEWYLISCAGCSLDTTLNIPLAPPAS